MEVKIDLKAAAEMLKARGLEPNGRVQRLFTNEVAKQSDPYVPMRQGILKNSLLIMPDKIIYNTPYARNMYYGIVMVDPKTRAAGFLTAEGWRSRKGIAKIPSAREYSYHDSPKRGKLWERRMWADKSQEILDNVAGAIGGSK